jgi:hypothetical protein
MLDKIILLLVYGFARGSWCGGVHFAISKNVILHVVVESAVRHSGLSKGHLLSNQKSEIWWTSLFGFTPDYIDWLFESRPKINIASINPPSFWLNHTIVLMSAFMVEGAVEVYLRKALRDQLGKGFSDVLPTTNLNERLASQLDKEIRTDSWDRLKQKFLLTMGTKFSDTVTPGSSETIAMLFDLRNAALAHGRAINSVGIEGQWDQFEWEDNRLRELKTFLQKKGLWSGSPAPPSSPPEPLNFLTDEIADFFYEGVLQLLHELGQIHPDGYISTDESKTTARILKRLGYQGYHF